MRNRVTRVHGTALVGLVCGLVVLTLAGFSHNLQWYIFSSDPGTLLGELGQAGGWGALLLTLGSSVFTAWKAAPTAADSATKRRPSKVSQLVFALAPPLLVVTLLLFLSAAGYTLVRALWEDRKIESLQPIALLSCSIVLLLAAYELIRDRLARAQEAHRVRSLTIIAGALIAFALPGALITNGLASARPLYAVVASIGLFFIVTRWVNRARNARTERTSHAGQRDEASGFIPAVVGLGAGAAFAALWFLLVPGAPASEGTDLTLALAIGILAFCGAFAAGELILHRDVQIRGLGLVSSVFTLLALSTGLEVGFASASAEIARIVLALALVTLGWIVGLGWMADPNQLSLHTFYKARLTRAYMGASNVARDRDRQITEAIEGDDVKLSELKNCQRGGPYHLINTTLNLVGGRDLATVQRAADSFLLSSRFCGSTRTGFRPTRQYMGDRLEIGTAVAISGAAASPNMGTRTPSAALAMLLTLFNVRLGYWAPTPNRERWESEQARLWPFYTLRELLSQTTDLASFCYLTDGGHFDNSALYSLVARGCHTIVVLDCGADPRPCFEDIGTAIRRSRIDFGAEIDLKIDAFLPGESGGPSTHYVLGEIRYSPDHIRWLEQIWGESPGTGVGQIAWIKPGVTRTGETADVRQYGIENDDFPQQTTGDQWFGESQFESYRKLGERSTTVAFAGATDRFGATPAGLKNFLRSTRLQKPARKIPFAMGVRQSGPE